MTETLFPVTTPAAEMKTAHMPTKAWATELIVERYLPNLTNDDYVLEPTCAEGNFLTALPDFVRKVGVERDP
ncbi:MAG TPA: hypothetical protein VNF68_00345, partial [Candidatus Baltobacteraceae bacterium]|nr:hypothetical protein [Candidatus Baltobacteraceae bacterium]